MRTSIENLSSGLVVVLRVFFAFILDCIGIIVRCPADSYASTLIISLGNSA
jgi:hypothetical protein